MEDADRPSDADILDQVNSIQMQQAAALPYLGDKEPIDVLLGEYENGSQIFCAKIKKLAHHYSHIRRSRGDGNCFFRSFMFRHMELMLAHAAGAALGGGASTGGDAGTSGGATPEGARMVAVVRGWREKLLSQGFQELTFEDMLEEYVELLERVTGQFSKPRPSEEELLAICRDQNISQGVVMLLRFMTSCELQLHADFFAPFLEEPVEMFCRSHVEVMSEESDNVHIIALVNAIKVPIRVVYLSNAAGTDSEPEANHHDFHPTLEDAFLTEAPPLAESVPKITLLYRPGHYDILYQQT
eukprot:jgi/Mesvir1/21609/Mv04035-RA.2